MRSVRKKKRAVRERKRAAVIEERERERERERELRSLSYRERATGVMATHMDCGLQVHANGRRIRRASAGAAHSSRSHALDNPYRIIWRKLRIAGRSR